MEELAKFGQPEAKFVHPRFLDIRQIQGVPNQVGSVIRYRVPLVGLGSTLRLTKRVGLETLLYQVDERLVDHGKIIFNVAPTKDGNRRLSIYTAFDYKRGKGLRESDDVDGRQIIVSRVRARRRVEPCTVHHQGRGRAEARPPLVGLGFPTLHVPARFLTRVRC